MTPGASATPSLSTRRYRVHGREIAVSSPQPAAVEAIDLRLRSFAAPETGETAELRIELLCVPEPAAHAVEPPRRPSRPVYDLPGGEVCYSDAEDRLYLDFGGRVRGECLGGEGRIRLSMVDAEENVALAAHPALTLALMEAFKRCGCFSVHAAGLCIDGRGLILAGSSGAGKTTLAIALLRAGFGFLGDDLLFLELPEPGALRILAFPDELDITDETARLFPELEFLVRLPTPPLRWKHALRPEAIYPVRLAHECAPGLLLFPQVGGSRRSALQRIGADEALLELAPNVLLTETRSSQAHLDALAALASASTCYRLETGRDFDALAECLRALAAA